MILTLQRCIYPLSRRMVSQIRHLYHNNARDPSLFFLYLEGEMYVVVQFYPWFKFSFLLFIKGANFFPASLRNCINCVSLRRSFLHFISFSQFIYDSFHISLTPNIVHLLDVTFCVRLHTLWHVVACCCAKFETGHTFSPVQTDATLLANNSQHCWELLRPFARSLRV